MNDTFVKTCPGCGTGDYPFYSIGGENDTPYGAIFAAVREKDGSYTPDMEKSFGVKPIVCVSCGHIMLFRDE